MKRLTLLLIIGMMITGLRVHADFLGELIVEGNVEGTIGETMPCQIVNVSISSEDYSFAVEDGEDVSSWFTNLPSGLSGEVLSVNGSHVQVNICGTPQETSEEMIAVSVPDGKILDYYEHSIGDISNTPSEDAVYIIKEKTPYALYDRPSTVSGIVGEELEIQYVYIRLVNTRDDIDMWDYPILQEINGLKATVVDYDSDSQVMIVEYSGTPKHEDHDLIHSIVYENLITYDEDLIVPDREDVLFDINPKEEEKEEEKEENEEEKDEKAEPPYLIPRTGVE